MLVGETHHFRWLEGVIVALFVLNVLDAIFTLVWVRLGLAEEANELLRNLVERHAIVFMMVKISLVSLGSIVLWRRRQNPSAVVAIFGAFLVYYAILLYHLRFRELALRPRLSHPFPTGRA